jgi:Tfp pilus assembly protein PilO
MTDYSDEPRHSISARAMDISRAALRELMAWDLFKWIVVALLAANCLLVAGFHSRMRSDIAELNRDRTTYAQEIADARTTLDKDIAGARAGLVQAISEMRSDVGEEVAKVNAKLDALIESLRKPLPNEKLRR